MRTFKGSSALHVPLLHLVPVAVTQQAVAAMVSGAGRCCQLLSLFSSSGNAAGRVNRRSHSAAGLTYVCAYQRRVSTPLRMCLLSEHGPLCAAARLSLHVCLAGPWACSALQCVVVCCVWQHLALFWGLLADVVSPRAFTAPA
jgi:hypothetical protein